MAMTRETKIGVAVSGTFACLVCLIVGFKLYEEPQDDSTPTPETKPAPVVVANAPEPPTFAFGLGSLSLAALDAKGEVKEVAKQPSPVLASTGAPRIEAGGTLPGPAIYLPEPPAAPPAVSTNVGGPPPPPPPPPAEKTQHDTPVKENGVNQEPDAEMLYVWPKVEGTPSPTAVRLENARTSDTGGSSAPPLPPPPPVAQPVVPAPVPPVTDKVTTIAPPGSVTLQPPLESKFVPAPEEPKVVVPAPAGPTGPVEPLPPPDTKLTPVNNTGAPTPPPPVPGSEEKLAPIPAPPPPPPPVMPKPMDTPAWPDAKTTPIPPPPPPPSPPITGPMTPAQADSSSGAFLRPIDSARDTAPARPVAAPAQVEMSTYLPVKIQTGDTFKELSKRYYSSDKYDKALEQYNRNHGEASDAMQQEGTLVPGEKAFVPSKTYLEKHYRSAIPDLPAETPATPMPTPEVRGSSVGSQPVRKVVPAYEVAPGGETWQAIAQATLGSPDRSGEIKALNPGITQEMVPAGTLLKLPADAQIQGSGGLR